MSCGSAISQLCLCDELIAYGTEKPVVWQAQPASPAAWKLEADGELLHGFHKKE